MAGAALPLPWPYLPDSASPQSLTEAMRQTQENLDVIARAIGSGLGPSSKPVTFQNSWGNFGSGGANGAIWVAGGMVHLAGIVTKSGNFVAGQTILTFDAGLAPSGTHEFAVVALGNAGASRGTGAIQVTADAKVNLTAGAPANPVHYVALTGTWKAVG